MKTIYRWVLGIYFLCPSLNAHAQPTHQPDSISVLYTKSSSPGKPVRVFRKYDHSRYEVVDTSLFYLYKKQVRELGAKISVPLKTVYSFSLTATSPIIPLTAENLKNAWPANTRFHYLLDSHFSSDQQLMQYDRFLKIYKIKYLFNQSIKQTTNEKSIFSVFGDGTYRKLARTGFC